VFRSTEPAWNDRNLHELAGHLRSSCVVAHIRASTGSPVQQTNCHPFRRGRWLFAHNGLIHGFHAAKRDLAMAVDPSLYPDIEGTTDTEMFFYLALTFGLEDDPPAAVARAVGLIEETGRHHGEPFPMQMAVATTDGESFYGFRYSSAGRSRSLFHSNDVSTLREQYPDNPLLSMVADAARLVVIRHGRRSCTPSHRPRLATG
jgi:predicted glutamine amidotransferase